MNPISLAMDGLLAVLLLTAVAVGVRLNGKLKVLRESQAAFVKAVGDLDLAAARAESGLASLRAATQEAHDQLLARIETARTLSARLDRASEDAGSAAARLEEGVRGAEGAARRLHAAAEARPPAPVERRPPAEAAGGAPIPFPSLRKAPAEPDVRAALLAAGRIVQAEEAAPPPDLHRAAAAAATGGVDRLARFVARRRGVGA